jgi:hypothetical protein
MFIAIVQIPGVERSREEAITAGMNSVGKFAGMDGLNRKYYLNGENGGGGVYIWESREKAEAFYNEDWFPMMEKAFGVRPTLTFYDNYVVVDNLAGEVRVDGTPVEAEQRLTANAEAG